MQSIAPVETACRKWGDAKHTNGRMESFLCHCLAKYVFSQDQSLSLPVSKAINFVWDCLEYLNH